MNIAELQKEAHRIAVEHGFWDDLNKSDPRHFTSLIALAQSELSEALEACRNTTLPSFERDLQITEELGDAIIRILDLAEGFGFDLESVIIQKMAYNEKRPRLHGKRF